MRYRPEPLRRRAVLAMSQLLAVWRGGTPAPVALKALEAGAV